MRFPNDPYNPGGHLPYGHILSQRSLQMKKVRSVMNPKIIIANPDLERPKYLFLLNTMKPIIDVKIPHISQILYTRISLEGSILAIAITIDTLTKNIQSKTTTFVFSCIALFATFFTSPSHSTPGTNSEASVSRRMDLSSFTFLQALLISFFLLSYHEKVLWEKKEKGQLGVSKSP